MSSANITYRTYAKTHRVKLYKNKNANQNVFCPSPVTFCHKALIFR